MDEYVNCLLSLIGATSSSVEENAAAVAASSLRLAEILALKAAISRRWKDRGRGRAATSNDANGEKRYLSEHVKQLVRMNVVNLVIAGRHNNIVTATNSSSSNDIHINFITTINEITAQQLVLLQDRQLQHNAASLLSKIGRLDLPLKFHELIPTLIEAVKRSQEVIAVTDTTTTMQTQQPFQLIQYNAMNALEATLSEISTQRLLVDRKYRNSISMQYLGSVVEYGLIPSLNTIQASLLTTNSLVDEDEGVLFRVHYATLCSRVVCHMLNSSLSKLVEDATAVIVVDHTLTFIHKFLVEWLPRMIIEQNNIMPNGTTTPLVVKAMNELLHVHCDMIVEIQKFHATSFIRYLEPFLNLFHSSLLSMVEKKRTSSSSSSSNGGFVISFLSFLGNVASTTQYCEDAAATNVVWVKVFNPQVILSLSHILLHLFNSNQEGVDDDDDEIDSHQWKDDAEAFFQWELQRSSDEDVGSAAQNLFLALVESKFPAGSPIQGGKEVVLPWLIDLLGNVASQRLAVEIEGSISRNIDVEIIHQAMPLGAAFDSSLTQGSIEHTFVMQWDAIYTAAGLAGTMLEGLSGFHFGSWFENCLGPNLSILLQQSGSQQQTHDCLPILQRRIVWLVSCHANQVNISSQLNPLGMAAAALSRPDDVCLRLTAVQAVDALLPYCEETPQLLHSITEATIPALYRLTNDCAEVESRSSSLDLLSNIITYVSFTGGLLSTELLNSIVAPLSTIWENAVDQNLLLRRNVLSIIACVASFVGPNEATALYPLALPMIDDSFGREENVFLVDEASKIWWVFLQLSNGYDPLLGKLYLRAPALSKDLEHVKVLMRITEYYIILGRDGFLNDHATTIQAVLCNIVGEVSPRGAAYVGLVLEALLRLFPSEGGKMLDCGIIDKFLEACANNYFGIDSCDPDRVIVIYMTALARVSLANPALIQNKLPTTLQAGTFGHAQLVDLYVKRFQVAGNGAHGLLFQSIWGMLLLSFYPPSHIITLTNSVLERSNDIFGAFVYLLRNVNRDGSNILSYEVECDDEEERIDRDTSAYDALLQEQATCDKLLSSNFRHQLTKKLSGLSVALGNDEYCRFLSTLDNIILQQLQEMLAN